MAPSGPSCMLREIRQQGETLARIAEHCGPSLAQLAARHRSKRLHLAGCGDMHFAAEQTAWLTRLAWGGEARAWRSMDFRWAWRTLSPADVVVCCSVSGRTPRTVEAAGLARRAGALTVGVTDNPGSPLWRAVDEPLVLGTAPPEELTRHAYAGYRHVIGQTQTFTATLLVQIMLASTWRRPAPGGHGHPWWVRIGADLDRWVERLDERARQVGETFFPGAERVLVLGSGPHLPAARYGAAKLLEFAVPAAAQCLEEFNHLEAFVSDAGTRLLVLAMDAPSRHRAEELTGEWERLGANSLVIAPEGEFGGERTRRLATPRGASLLEAVLIEIVALQLLAAHGARPLGRDPNRWLGGRRDQLIQRLSQRTIRASRIWEAPAEGADQASRSP